MKRITLAFVALTAGSVVGMAQEPPTPPARPVPAPAPTPRPSEPAPVAPAPRARPAAPVPFRDFDYEIDRDRVREVERQAQEIAREASRIDQEQVREITRRADEMGPALLQFLTYAALIPRPFPTDTTTYADASTRLLVARAMARRS